MNCQFHDFELPLGSVFIHQPTSQMPTIPSASTAVYRNRLAYFALIIFFLFCSFFANGQNVKIHEDPAVSKLMDIFVEVNKNNKTTSGWRIQIASTTDRREVDDVMTRFGQSYPDIILNWVHAKPYYQVRVGAFRTKMESLRLLSMVKDDFPNAYPVFDNNIKQSEIAGVKN